MYLFVCPGINVNCVLDFLVALHFFVSQPRMFFNYEQYAVARRAFFSRLRQTFFFFRMLLYSFVRTSRTCGDDDDSERVASY